MTQLNDLPNEILLKVLERVPATDLFIVQRVSRRLSQLAAEVIQAKVKRVWLSLPRKDLSSCPHLEPADRDELIVLDSMFKGNDQALRKRSTKALFLKVLDKCSGVKSIDFGNIMLYGDVFQEVIKRCPELECLKVGRSEVKESLWERVLDQIGPKIVHFVRISEEEYPMPFYEDRLLEMVAEKCPNIKRVDWAQEDLLENELMQAFKKLPEGCWTALNLLNHLEEIGGYSGEGELFMLENVFDEMTIDALDVCGMGESPKRVSILKFNVFEKFHRGIGVGMKFEKLKKLDFIGCEDGRDEDSSLCCLTFSEFPALEELSFPARYGITEKEYKLLFRTMKMVKKLTIAYDYEHGLVPNLPESTIHQMESLETIYIEFGYVPRDIEDEPKKFLQQIEQYIDGISSLKKLTIDFKYLGCDLWELNLFKEVKRMKEKQNQVEVEMIFRK